MKNFLLLSLVLISTILFAEEKVNIYKNFAQITSYPTFHFKQGVRTYNWKDVPSQILPETIRFSSGEPTVKLLSQTVVNANNTDYSILKEYKDKIIKLSLKNNENFSAKLLLASPENYIYVQNIVSKEIVRVNNNEVSSLSLPNISTLNIEPNLNLTVYSKNDKQTKSKISYLSSGFSWNSNINLIISDSYLQLSNWISIENNSDKSLVKADLSVLEGVVISQQRDNDINYKANRAGWEAKNSIQENDVMINDVNDAYEFIIPDKVTISPQQKFQYLMLNKENIDFIKKYTYNTNSKNINQSYYIQNTKENNLGVQIPSSKVYLYKKNGLNETFIGESQIDFISKEKEIVIEVGDALDLEAFTESELIEDTKEYSVTNYKVNLKNYKDDAVSFIVKHRLANYYRATSNKIISSDENYEIEKGNAIFNITILKKGSHVFEFQVKSRKRQ